MPVHFFSYCSKFQLLIMTIDTLARLAQDCIKHHPVVVLASGASMDHSIRGMTALSEVLQEKLSLDNDQERRAWQEILASLHRGVGLEQALQDTASPPSLIRKIVALTWETIASDDLALLHRAALRTEQFPLSRLIEGLFKSTNTTINIVTPNYDRVAEYATDLAQCVHATGFVPGIIRSREGTETTSIRNGPYLARTVRIWKVHGSLDWFEDQNRNVISIPVTTCLPIGLTPLIVTPGVSKYERTHDEPFRSAIHGADAALETANALLCVGYGFRDTHIQAKLIERCRQASIPVVILARTLTDEAKQFLKTCSRSPYLALEHCEEGTRAFWTDEPNGTVVQDQTLWSFRNFNELVF